MQKTNTPFERVLDALQDDSQKFPAVYLQSFSDIEPVELQAFLKIWSKVPKKRKHSFCKDLEKEYSSDTLLSFDNLAGTLLDDRDPLVRRSAIRLLWESNDPRLAEKFLQILDGDPDEETRAESAVALGAFVYLGELDELDENLQLQIEEGLLSAAGGAKSQLIQRKAVEALGYSSRPEISTLLETAFSHQDPSWIASALFAMGRSGSQRWQDKVISMLRHENAVVRLAAVQSAGELGLKLARPFLLELLNDEMNVEIFHAAIWSLSQIGGEDVQTYLENLFDNAADKDEAHLIEDALENLAFTEDMDQFDLLAFDYEDEPEE